jgi:hypothetical protein
MGTYAEGHEALIYVFAADDENTDLASEISSGRMYKHNLELMGGKLSVYANQFNQWFAGLWHGRPLAYTVAGNHAYSASRRFGQVGNTSGHERAAIVHHDLHTALVLEIGDARAPPHAEYSIAPARARVCPSTSVRITIRCFAFTAGSPTCASSRSRR